jgi:hypothetical protein
VNRREILQPVDVASVEVEGADVETTVVRKRSGRAIGCHRYATRRPGCDAPVITRLHADGDDLIEVYEVFADLAPVVAAGD